MKNLWASTSEDEWRHALADYNHVITQQGVESLAELERWYQNELPPVIASRTPAFVTLAELVRVTEWKMARGVWRGRNLFLVRGNDASLVEETSVAAFAIIPHPTAPIATLSKLAGVGPATASAVLAAAHPDLYPFFDEIVADQIPDMGKLAFTLGYYARYAQALRERAGQLGGEWTPVLVERALWANCGGKAGWEKAEPE